MGSKCGIGSWKSPALQKRSVEFGPRVAANLTSIVAGLALASTAVSQQTSLQAQTLGPVATLATGAGEAVLDFAASGTPIVSGSQSFNVTARIDQGTYLSSTTLDYPAQPFEDGIGLNFFERAYARGSNSDACGTSNGTAAGSKQLGPHSLLLTFANTPGARGKLVFQFRANAGTTGTVSAAIDIGNDNSFEVQSSTPRTREIPLTIPSSSNLLVRVDDECHVTGAGTASFQSCETEVWVGFRPDRTATCTISNYGQDCGPTATGTDTVIGNHRLPSFLVTNAFPQGPVISIADANGIATHSMAVPATMVGTSFHHFVPVRLLGQNLVIQTSDGLQVSCR